MEKIFFKLNVVDGYPPVSMESVWSERLDSGLFKIVNIPFYTKDASLGDAVSAEVGVDRELIFKEVVVPGENSTFRIVVFDDGVNQIQKIIEALVEVGCTWEGMGERFYSFNVPGDVDLDDVLVLLDKYVQANWLDYEYGMIRQ
ncbi:DUF4265 domain-containing protein [Burkholderia sp. AU30280]|uniref:DUF4265 domain-containing protein n=1 Tax=Burkholderia sp. AU30280 TaxID=2879628 RepID=UPI001CF0FB1A|nr:DUF4265 domain-containing protein [Burkholderia sp. AU30280]MCA8277348.1 DUF4265 domain-containing protein [Burkholderia sp. AU30280]